MLVRIVKLTFKEDSMEFFFQEFNRNKAEIIKFNGCRGMKLLHDIKQKNIIMTYSHWDDENALNDYRKSTVFNNLWNNIKPHFQERPEAWSHEIYFDGFHK
jgi:hypothetical protein